MTPTVRWLRHAAFAALVFFVVGVWVLAGGEAGAVALVGVAAGTLYGYATGVEDVLRR